MRWATQESKVYLNWLLGLNTNLIYHRFINNEIVKPSYSTIKGKTTFSLYKRKAYRNILTQHQYTWRDFTDCTKTRRGKCWTEWRDLYFYWVSPDWTAWVIFKAYQDASWRINCIVDITTPFCTCECGNNQFQKTTRARGIKKVSWYNWSIVRVNLGTEAEPNYVQRFVDDDWQTFTVWDYLYIKCWNSTALASAYNQVRTIATTNPDWTISLNAPFTWIIAPNELDGIEFEVYSEYGEVVLYPTCAGMMMLDPTNQHTSLVCWTSSVNSCIKSIIQNNWNILYLNSNGFLTYSQWWTNNLYFQSAQTLSLWPNVLWVANLKRNIIYFGNDFTWVVYPQTAQDGTTYYNQYSLSDTVWVRSPMSYYIDNEAMLMFANNKRLYTVTLVANWWSYELKLEDISDLFKWDLDLIDYWDEVYISKYNNEIRLHIIWKSIENLWGRTKMLIFDQDYKLYHIHTVCCSEVTKTCWDLFLWDWVFARCWFEDCWFPDENNNTIWTQFYDQVIEIFVWSNESNWTGVDLLRPKKVEYIKTSLWPSIITDSTMINYTQYRDCYMSEYSIRDFKTCSIDNWNKIAQWLEIEPDECMIDDLKECHNLARQCKGIEPQQEERVCKCPAEYKQNQDYCVCYKDNAYFLSPVHDIVTKPKPKRSKLVKVQWIAQNWDALYFEWMVMRIALMNYDDDYTNNLVENEKCCYTPCETKCIQK